jgi:hypothetical protein
MLSRYRYFPALLLVAGVWIATPACAAQTYGYRDRGYARELERRAYDNGFREGLQEGQNDARRGHDFSYERHNEFRDADQGFRRGDGDRDLYRRSYRQGFETGYGEAYKRFAPNDGRSPRGSAYPTYPIIPPYATSPEYPSGRGVSLAAQNGHRDGFDAGRNDARDRARFDPVRAKRYREGDHDYDNRYGSRDDYKRDYRAAFEQGYREGYGDASRPR